MRSDLRIDLVRLKVLHAQKLSCRLIAKRMGFSYEAIHQALTKCGLSPNHFGDAYEGVTDQSAIATRRTSAHTVLGEDPNA